MTKSQEKSKMHIINLKDIKPIALAGGQWWDLVIPSITSNEHIAVCLAKYEPDIWLYKHYHNVEECYFLLQGELLVELDGETKKVPEKSVVYIPSGVRHRFKCCSSSPATILCMIADKDWIYDGPNANSFKLKD